MTGLNSNNNVASFKNSTNRRNNEQQSYANTVSQRHNAERSNRTEQSATPAKKKAVIFSDSMARRISSREFNRHTPNQQTLFRSFPGANCKSLQSYVEPTLNEESVDTVAIHIGTNDLSPRPNTQAPLTDAQIAHEIQMIAAKCKSLGTRNVIISSIIPRQDPNIDQRRINVNLMLREMCGKNNLIYLNNDNIDKSRLWKDGLHLTNEGIAEFAANLSAVISQTSQ